MGDRSTPSSIATQCRKHGLGDHRDRKLPGVRLIVVARHDHDEQFELGYHGQPLPSVAEAGDPTPATSGRRPEPELTVMITPYNRDTNRTAPRQSADTTSFTLRTPKLSVALPSATERS